MDKLKKALSRDNDEEEGIVTQISDASTLSFATRLKCFAACFCIGIVLSIIGTILLFFQNWTGFAILYTIGNVVGLCSTCFLMGPLKQIKKMFQETRLIATILVFVMMALTLCAALWWHIPILAIIFCILQFLALTWYAISYIPFARDAVKKCFEGCIGS
ncbi:unnamed protein product [Owenia fusiformis]|uniref:Vesicle transport protein n=1 Tax=Owenia fusiformis TaxID=6347 RepID=A0A8J1TA66_OWEFU|nr:unnamed protein product [Owenia fusiformis]